MLDLPKFMREMKYLKVAMRGLLSQDQHNFCNRYAMNALVDDADDSDWSGFHFQDAKSRIAES